MTELERVDQAAGLLLQAKRLLAGRPYAALETLIDLALLLLGRRLAELARDGRLIPPS